MIFSIDEYKPKWIEWDCSIKELSKIFGIEMVIKGINKLKIDPKIPLNKDIISLNKFCEENYI
jgi:hypothetical protein